MGSGQKDQVVGEVAKMPVSSSLDGVVRGLLKSGLEVNQGMKIGDVDPREKKLIVLLYRIKHVP